MFYIQIVKLKFKEVMQYRVAFINNLFAQFFAYMVTFINLSILLKNIHFLDGWSITEIQLLWVLNVFSYGIAGMFFYNGCNALEEKIQSGEMDIFYTQPRSIFWNFMFRNISPIFIFHICFSTIFLICSLRALNIGWSMTKLLYMIVLLICAVCIQASVMIAFASTSFRIIKSGNIVSTAIYGFRNFTTYPFSIYGKGMKLLLTFMIPYAFVSYYPALYILDKESNLFDSCMIYLEPFFVGLFILLAYNIWRKGTYVYKGTGT